MLVLNRNENKNPVASLEFTQADGMQHGRPDGASSELVEGLMHVSGKWIQHVVGVLLVKLFWIRFRIKLPSSLKKNFVGQVAGQASQY